MNTSPLPLERRLAELLSEDPAAAMGRERSTFDMLIAPLQGRFVLFGAGRLGKGALHALRRQGIEPLAFSDNSPALWGTAIDGIRVLSPVDAASEFGHSAAFVVATMDYHSASRQLLGLHCDNVISFLPLFWKYPAEFLPFFDLELPHRTLSQREPLERVFSLWADNASRQEFVAQVTWRLLGDFALLPPPVDGVQYFPDGLFTLIPNEVFVDCGAFDGDVIRTIIDRRTDFERIVALEPDPVNFEHLRQSLSQLPKAVADKISARRACVAAKKGALFFEAAGTDQSRVSEQGTLETECIALDDLLEECTPTYVKMDIEGAEMPALHGAERMMRKSSAIWAVSVYHQPEDLWQIPLYMISHLDAGHYRFFLRRHSPAIYDLVCYAVPVDRLER